MSEKTVHHGHNIKRIREIQRIKQETLAGALGDDWNQKKISLLENKEVVDEALLAEVAKALNVTPEAIKGFTEEVAINIISSTLYDNAGSINNQCTLSFNPLDKYIEQVEKNERLYEALLQSEREKIALLERLLSTKG